MLPSPPLPDEESEPPPAVFSLVAEIYGESLTHEAAESTAAG